MPKLTELKVFDFNFYSSLLLLPFSQGVLFSAVMIGGARNAGGKSNNLIGTILLLITMRIAFWMLGFAGWYDSHDGFTSFMFYFPFNTTVLIGPLFYYYFLVATNQNFKLTRRHLPDFILPITWALLIIGKFAIDFLFYFPFADDIGHQFGTKGPLAELDKTVLFNVISYFSLFYYVGLTLKSFFAFRKYASANLSSFENVDFIWLKNVLISISCGLLVMFIYQLVNWCYPLSYRADWYSYLFLGILVYYLSINGLLTQRAPKPTLYFAPELADVPNVNSPEMVTELEKWMPILNETIDQQKPFLIPDLTLSQLSSKINTNPVLLSRIINNGHNLNFNDFINAYRVREVIRQIEGGQHKAITLLAIALDSGFNSKATFNRAFKKYTGKSPIAYIKALERELS